jgi:hypothetical protein
MILKTTIANKIHDFIKSEIYSFEDQSCGTQEAADKVSLYVEELMRIAYEDGVREGGALATSFEWGSRRKDVSFERWFKDNENSL